MKMSTNVSGIPKDISSGGPEVARFLSGKGKSSQVSESMAMLQKAFEQPDKLPGAPSPGRETSAPPKPAARDEPTVVAEKKGKTRNMVEKSICLDPDQHRLLRRYANMEGLRLDSQVPVSEIVRVLIDYALAFVKDGKVIPTSDGQGLHLPGRQS